MERPYLTADLPGTGGELRRRVEDFVVEEVPLYSASGEGEHLLFRVRKAGLSSFEAIRRIARALDLPEREVGYAGLKDARAVTSQWMSVRGVEPERLASLSVRDLRIDGVARHHNKLRVGHLRGNRFRIRVREAVPDARERAAEILDRLLRRGAPNFFGEQRFGVREDSHTYGEAILKRDYPRFIALLLGGSSELEKDPRRKEARAHFNAGRVAEAYEAMPIRYRAEKKALHALLRFKDEERAFFSIPLRMRQIFVSSYQSHLFNRLLERRLPDIDRLLRGDIAWLHRNGALFRVEDPDAEQPRCSAFEISPSGPLFGTEAMIAEGEPGLLEREILESTGMTAEDWAVGGGLALHGIRRSLRIPLRDLTLSEEGPGTFSVGFFLQPGSFATAVLSEIRKPDAGPVAEPE